MGGMPPIFITICTQNRACYFGEIIVGKMELSELGEIAHQYSMEIPTHFPYVHLGAFVVMPNHVRGVIIIDKPNISFDDRDGGDHPVETLHATSLQSTLLKNSKNEFMANISPKTYSLSTIIRSYKSAVTKHAHRLGLGFDFAWQTRFHDHIIRNQKS